MSRFDKEIQNFQRYGIYKYKFDESGNLTFNSSSLDFSRVYLSIPLQNFNYKQTKVDSYYSGKFTEFLPTEVTQSNSATTLVQSTQESELESENKSLKLQLDSLTLESEDDSTSANKEATKEVILELRKSLGQGRVDSDFISEFPYSPIRKDVK